MKISPRRVEGVTWPLVYGGLVVAVLGYALQPEQAGFGWVLIVAGAGLVAVGLVLIWLRSRMRDPARADPLSQRRPEP